MYTLIHYVDEGDLDLFALWLNGLSDNRVRARIAARLVRLENGNFGDCKSVGAGVWELRIDTGPGYRVYYAILDKKVILLCDGGDKKTQERDIDRAKKRWMDWKSRSL